MGIPKHSDPDIYNPPIVRVLSFNKEGNSMGAYKTIKERFYEKVKRVGECHVWHGAVSTSGYGVIGLPRSAKTEYVHRLAHKWHIGSIPRKYQIDHLCLNKLCVNPEHLEAVPQQINLERQNKQRWGNRTHCNHGHDLKEFQRTTPSGRTYCTECYAERRRRKRLRDPGQA